MYAILSPAKRMQTALIQNLSLSRPVFQKQAGLLIRILRDYSPWQLESILKVNPELALNAHRLYQDFDLDQPGTAALLSYHGLQYQALDAQSLSQEDLLFAQNQIRILSGLYGILRPLDEIQPYRLEMQCRMPKLPHTDCHSLYHFWGSLLYQALFQTGETVINLASAEYSRAVTPFLKQNDRMISCDFLTVWKGKLKTIATSAKMARGQAARFLILNRITAPEGLKQFEWDGYEYSAEHSTLQRYVFIRQG